MVPFRVELLGAERARLWDEAVDYYAGYDTYRVRAGEREIPIVVLERAASGGSTR